MLNMKVNNSALLLLLCCVHAVFSSGIPLNVSSITDGPCRSLPKIDLSDLNFELALHFAEEAGYVPLASKFNYYHTAKILKRVPPEDLEILKETLCLKLATGLFQSVLTGLHGAHVELECELEGLTAFTCTDKANRSYGKTTIHLVWSDNEKHLLSVSCFPDGKAAWNVLSTERFVDKKNTEIILREIEKYGFKRENAMTLSYDKC